MATNNPAAEGYDAYNKGIWENPYPKNTPDYDAWQRGFEKSAQDNVDNHLGMKSKPDPIDWEENMK